MSDIYGDDYRDLDNPANIVTRTGQQRREALIYFLKAGSITAFQQRVDFIREVEPDFVIDLHLADLENAALWQVNLAKADMRAIQMPWCDLRRSILTQADLTGANLMGADLRGANLSGAKLTGADLRGADLDGANLRDADLSGALQGEIPAEYEKENPTVRRPIPRLPTRDRNPQLPGNVGMGEALTGGYAAPKRDYGLKGPQLKDGPSPAQEVQKKMDEDRKKKKGELDKFHKKKKVQQKFFDKKKKEAESANSRKKKDQEVWERKQKQQEKFIQQKYSDDKNKKK